MKKRYILVLIFLIQSFTFENSKAQYIPIQIYDLIVVTDSLNEDYLFFRIQESPPNIRNQISYQNNLLKKVFQYQIQHSVDKYFF